MITEPLDIDKILQGSFETGHVDRTVGDSILYVTLPNGSLLGMRPERLLVKSHGSVARYRGESFRKLGLVDGAEVDVYGQDDPDTPDCVVIDVDHKRTLWRKLLSGL